MIQLGRISSFFLDRDNEDGAVLAITDDQEDDEIDRPMRGVVMGAGVMVYLKREQFSRVVVGKPAVRLVVEDL